jgi:hypothetical protein
MTSADRPLPDPNDPMVERILAFRLSDIKTAIDNRDGAGVQRAIEELGRELHPDLADKVLHDLLGEGLRTLSERIGNPATEDPEQPGDAGAEG